ncbi:MAG: hypothetical protein V7641_4433 [Blastocatellia bacterium]
MKKTASMMVACLLTFTILCQQTAAANLPTDKETRFAQKVKAGILKLGVGETTRVDVKLKDKTQLTGYISEISDNSFAVTALKSG